MEEETEKIIHESEQISFEISLTEKVRLSRYCVKYNLDKSTLFSILLTRLLKEEDEKEKGEKLKTMFEKGLNIPKMPKK